MVQTENLQSKIYIFLLYKHRPTDILEQFKY